MPKQRELKCSKNFWQKIVFKSLLAKLKLANRFLSLRLQMSKNKDKFGSFGDNIRNIQQKIVILKSKKSPLNLLFSVVLLMLLKSYLMSEDNISNTQFNSSEMAIVIVNMHAHWSSKYFAFSYWSQIKNSLWTPIKML